MKNEEEKENKYGVLLPAVILIIIGIVFLLPQFGFGTTSDLWPAFILAPGLGFLAMWLASGNRQKLAGLLIPGTVATLIGLFFIYLNFAGWDKMSRLWPMFMVIVGIAFYAFFLAGGRNQRTLLIPANITLVAGVLFLALSSYSYKFWPVVLIVLGILIILLDRRKKEIVAEVPEEEEPEKKKK